MSMERHPTPHRNLVAWQKGRDLVFEVYKLTQAFPEKELYGLTSQLRRAALSEPSNIAEGAADRSPAQFAHFLANAIGSLNEMDTQLQIALQLGYLSEAAYQQAGTLLDECLAVTYGLKKSVARKR
jgi:four helix bundle protein